MSDYYVRKVLTDYQVHKIHELINDSSSYWESGLRTFGTSERHKKIKSNEELTGPQEILQKIYDITWQGIDNDLKFFSFTAPDVSEVPMITRTTPGGRYRLHHDDPDNGDFSTTIFLSDPDTYDGGELVLKTIGGPLQFKLPAGHAITYKTGIPHQVNLVSSGVRYVTVFWTTTKFKNPNIRKIWGDIKYVCKLLEQKHGYDAFPIIENIDESDDNPRFLLDTVLNNIERDFKQNL